jgi:RimJ/RimL family protein N-acetyltransferase
LAAKPEAPAHELIQVRHAAACDAEGIHQLLKTIAAETPFLGDWGSGVGIDQLRQFLDKSWAFALLLVAVTGDAGERVVGYSHVINSTVFGMPRTMSHVAQVAVAVNRDFRNRGVAGALVRQAVTEAAQWMDLHLLRASIWENNRASLTVFERAGFREVARIPEQFRDERGDFYAEVLMSLSLSEWRAAHASYGKA